MSVLTALSVVVLLTACKDLVGNQPASAGTPSPETYETPAGALMKATGVRGLFGEAANAILLNTGLLSDELTIDPALQSAIDARQLPEGDQSEGATMYAKIQNLRVQAALAVIALRRAFPDSHDAVRGEMFAIQGYAELWLADAFCAGSPLSMPVEGADYQYAPSLPRDSTYAHALTLFDSATAITTDSARIAVLAKVGRARALLSLDSITAAAATVAGVQDTDRYAMQAVVGVGSFTNFGEYSVSDREGEVGLAYRSSLDPRTQSIPATVVIDFGTGGNFNYRTLSTYYPTKYPQSHADSSLYVVADGIEARLIEAEAALRSGQVTLWLQTLNDLRTRGRVFTDVWNQTIPVDVNGNPLPCQDPSHCAYGVQVDSTLIRVDTTWSAGTGGVAGLPALTDPGANLTGTAATKARVDTLFAERAAWLFLTGHRQSDLRRLMQQYPNEGDLFPHGPYPVFGGYGTAVKFAIPTTEKRNPNYNGCLD